MSSDRVDAARAAPLGGTPPRALQADAIVVLGCRVSVSGHLTAAAAGRADAAAEAYRAGVAPRVLASGGRRWGAAVEALALQRALVARGVPREAILTELWSLTTYENAVFSAALLRKLRARSAVIVSCAWHVPRALQSFRTAGLEVAAWSRRDAAGVYDRWAETLRAAYDDLAIRHTAVLRGRAERFFEDAGR